MTERSISKQAVLNLLATGNYLINRHNPDRYTVVSKDRSNKLAVVLSGDKTTVITIMYQGR